MPRIVDTNFVEHNEKHHKRQKNTDDAAKPISTDEDVLELLYMYVMQNAQINTINILQTIPARAKKLIVVRSAL